MVVEDIGRRVVDGLDQWAEDLEEIQVPGDPGEISVAAADLEGEVQATHGKEHKRDCLFNNKNHD